MQNWVTGLSDTGTSHQLIFTLYAFILSLPLRLVMQANHPRQLIVKLALGFSLLAT
jgi:hypothetical protein